MKPKLTFILSLTFLFLFSGSSVVVADDFQDGLDAYQKQDYKTAYKLFLPLAEQGNATAQYNLGVMYYEGRGVPQDYKEAFRLFRLSAEQGDATAQYNLGVMYYKGQGVPQDYKEAVKWFRLSAEQGDANAQNNLGVLYDNGRGVLQDYKEAAKWYRLSADQGNEDAQNNIYLLAKKNVPEALQFCIQKGKQGDEKAKAILYDLAKKNVPEALQFLVKDAKDGIDEAQNKLGEVYSQGLGLPQSYLDAHMWFNLSGSQGNRGAIRNRNRMERKMSPKQIVQAQEMARNWKPEHLSRSVYDDEPKKRDLMKSSKSFFQRLFDPQMNYCEDRSRKETYVEQQEEDGEHRKIVIHCKNGMRDGLYTQWHKKGGIHEQGHYKDGKRQGLWTWCTYGSQVITGYPYKNCYGNHFKDGLQHGKHTRSYKNGSKWIERNFYKGKKHGLYYMWDEFGQILEKTCYKHGAMMSDDDLVRNRETGDWMYPARNSHCN